jgi:hypothetical protein
MSTCLLWQILRKPNEISDNSDADTEMAKMQLEEARKDYQN